MAQGLEERVISLIAHSFNLSENEVDESCFLMDDLDLNPEDLEELSGLLAEEFGIKLADDDYETWENVGDVIAFVAEKLQEEE